MWNNYEWKTNTALCSRACLVLLPLIMWSSFFPTLRMIDRAEALKKERIHHEQSFSLSTHLFLVLTETLRGFKAIRAHLFFISSIHKHTRVHAHTFLSLFGRGKKKNFTQLHLKFIDFLFEESCPLIPALQHQSSPKLCFTFFVLLWKLTSLSFCALS